MAAMKSQFFQKTTWQNDDKNYSSWDHQPAKKYNNNPSQYFIKSKQNQWLMISLKKGGKWSKTWGNLGIFSSISACTTRAPWRQWKGVPDWIWLSRQQGRARQMRTRRPVWVCMWTRVSASASNIDNAHCVEEKNTYKWIHFLFLHFLFFVAGLSVGILCAWESDCPYGIALESSVEVLLAAWAIQRTEHSSLLWNNVNFKCVLNDLKKTKMFKYGWKHSKARRGWMWRVMFQWLLAPSVAAVR